MGQAVTACQNPGQDMGRYVGQNNYYFFVEMQEQTGQDYHYFFPIFLHEFGKEDCFKSQHMSRREAKRKVRFFPLKTFHAFDMENRK